MPSNETDLDDQFVHVEYQYANKPAASCTARGRSHVMKRYHRQKQSDTNQQSGNFRQATAKQIQGKRGRRGTNDEAGSAEVPRDPIAIRRLDPFFCMAADTSNLPTLLQNPLARLAGEPIINFNLETGYQALQLVFDSNIADPALLNAMLMALTFGIDGDQTSEKFLTYKGEALRWINGRMHDPERAATAPTIGAILLFIGVEARLGAAKSVEAHKRGVALLVQLCDSQATHLHDGVKRAIFWQDLFSTILTGSQRIISHDSFAELNWRRDPLCLSTFKVPDGFTLYGELLGPEFLVILEDIKALQSIRESRDVDVRDAVSVMHLDNHQASVESRLYDLGKDPMQHKNPTLYCCIHAAYLCTYALFTEVWNSTMIPARLTLNLLEKLQHPSLAIKMIENWDLYIWILSVGGTFAVSSLEQMEYALLLHQHIELQDPNVHKDHLLQILQRFIWSDRLFGKRWTAFWARTEVIPK